MDKATRLYIIPTPIGNLEDVTFRAIKILKEADIILAEDTRITAKLLKKFEITKPMLAFHQHNEHKILGALIRRLNDNETFALVSDAGTPGISDPGFLLVRECIKENIKVECLPGASAFIPALVVSGLPSDRFCFEGFLPIKKGRKKRLEELSFETRTIILYESPNRITKTLKELSECMGKHRNVSVSRELTKIFEETIRGTLTELITHYNANKPKGEFVLVIEGNNQATIKSNNLIK